MFEITFIYSCLFTVTNPHPPTHFILFTGTETLATLSVYISYTLAIKVTTLYGRQTRRKSRTAHNWDADRAQENFVPPTY